MFKKSFGASVLSGLVLGFAFESYNGIGAYQSVDAKNNKLTGAGRLTVEGVEVPYANIREFVAALVRDPAIESCMVRKVVQYVFARPLEAADDALVGQLSGHFHDGGRRWKPLLAAVAEGAFMRAPGVSQ